MEGDQPHPFILSFFLMLANLLRFLKKCMRSLAIFCIFGILLCVEISGQTDRRFFQPGMIDQCCMLGVQWSNTSSRCTGFPGPVPGIAPESQSACLLVLEVCCLKHMQQEMCEFGKQTALDQQLCAVRDSDPGAEQFRVRVYHLCTLHLCSFFFIFTHTEFLFSLSPLFCSPSIVP